MPKLDDYLAGNPDQQAGAYFFLQHSQDEVLETLEGVIGDLASVQNFAQLRKQLEGRRETVAALVADRARAREILRGGTR